MCALSFSPFSRVQSGWKLGCWSGLVAALSFGWMRAPHLCDPVTSVLESHILAMCVHAVTQSYPTLCDPMDCNLPDSSVHGIFHAKILEWVSISFSRGFSQPRDQTCVSCISCIGRQILYHCATWKSLLLFSNSNYSYYYLPHLIGKQI